MPSLLRMVGNWFRARKDDAAEQLKDPVRDGKFAIEDSKAYIRKFEAKLADLMAFSKTQERKLKEAEAEIDKWTKIAASAAKAGNEADVRSAVTSKQRALGVVNTLKAEVEKNRKEIEAVKLQLNRARTKISDAESDHVRLTAKLESAKVRKSLAEAETEFGANTSPLAALDDLKKEVDTAESQAEAYEEIAGETPAAQAEALETKYSVSGTEVDDEVAKLMAEAKKQ